MKKLLVVIILFLGACTVKTGPVNLVLCDDAGDSGVKTDIGSNQSDQAEVTPTTMIPVQSGAASMSNTGSTE